MMISRLYKSVNPNTTNLSVVILHTQIKSSAQTLTCIELNINKQTLVGRHKKVLNTKTKSANTTYPNSCQESIIPQ